MKNSWIQEATEILSENGYDIGEYNPHNTSAWLVHNDHTKCLVIGDNVQGAIDNAVDSGAWDSLLMSQEDYTEYESKGWCDSYVHAGNASEPFWCEDLHIELILTA